MSSPPAHEPSLAALDALKDVDALCVLVAEDERPLTGAAGFADWRLDGALSRVLLDGFFQGQWGEQLLMPAVGLPLGKLVVLGLGPVAKADQGRLDEALSKAAATLRRLGASSVALGVPEGLAGKDELVAEAIRRNLVPAFGAAKVTVLGPKGIRAQLG